MNEDEIRRILEEDSHDTDFSSDTDSEYHPGVETGSDSSEETERDVVRRLPRASRNNAETWISPANGSTLNHFIFTSHEENLPALSEPFDFYRLFLTDDILHLIVIETNKNARSAIERVHLTRNSRLSSWKDTDTTEMKLFFAIVMYMGLIKYPRIEDYWKHDALFSNTFVPKIMARNRFQILLRYIHFADNSQEAATSSRLFKIDKIIQDMVENFKKHRTPPENLVVDETMIPFRGRLTFRQYIPGKRHKYGLKMFKLTDPAGYTYNIQLYTGRTDHSTGLSQATTVCSQLIGEYFHQGRTLTVDNFYTSVELANYCLARRTHVQGTLRLNRRGVPSLPTNQLSRGECVTREREGIVVGVWRDKRNVSFLSTKHNGEVVATGKTSRFGVETKKPNVILEYNKCKQGIDLSDQLSSYFSPLRKTIRWYHKAVFEVLLNTAVVNAFLLYKAKFPGKNLSVSDVRKDIILSLVSDSSNQFETFTTSTTSLHILTKNTEQTKDNRRKRKRCTDCYARISMESGPDTAREKTQLVDTFCRGCSNKPFLCLEHFQFRHPSKD